MLQVARSFGPLHCTSIYILTVCHYDSANLAVIECPLEAFPSISSTAQSSSPPSAEPEVEPAEPTGGQDGKLS